MNNQEREQWIDNDEGLYRWWKSSKLSKRAFIKANRAKIDTVIRNVTEGMKPPHYLAYAKTQHACNALLRSSHNLEEPR